MIVKLCVLFSLKEEVLAPPPENDDVVNDFDIEEEVIEVENRSDIPWWLLFMHTGSVNLECTECEEIYLYLSMRKRNAALFL